MLNFKKSILFISLLILLSIPSCQNPTDTVVDTKLIANSGEDQTTIAGSYAVFDPTKSKGNFNWYEWRQDENNPDTVTIYSQNKSKVAKVDIHKIAFIKEGVYRFRLIVREGVTPSNYNGTNASLPDTLVITVNPNSNSKFEDPNLEATIRAKLNKQIDELDENALLSLDSLQSMPTPNRISSLKGLEYCTNLIYLAIGSQDISDISPLASLTKLKYLWLDQNRKISDVTPLAGLTDLEELNLDGNLITDISALQTLTKLNYLNLQINPINDISALIGMKNLETLYLFQASLEDISVLNNLINLKDLELPDCNLSKISALENLNNLVTLYIPWNQITDIKTLVDNHGFGKGDLISLLDNPLNDKSINEYIPALQARGVWVER